MRILLGLSILLILAATPWVQNEQSRANPGSACGDQSKGLPDFYYETVLTRMEPPDASAALIRITLGGERKLWLQTDGERFELWAGAPDRKIGTFLHELNSSCQLPADPSAAFALLKVDWKSKDLSPSQFGQLHRELTAGLSQYVSQTQQRYAVLLATRLAFIHLDARGHRLSYDNQHEHLEIEVYEPPSNSEMSPLVKWIHKLYGLGPAEFRQPS